MILVVRLAIGPRKPVWGFAGQKPQGIFAQLSGAQ